MKTFFSTFPGNLLPDILGFCIAFVVMRYLMRPADSPAPSDGNRRHLVYSRRIRLFTLLLIPVTAFVCYAAYFASRAQIFFALLVASFFILITLFSVYQVFFIRIAWDDEHLHYQSPLAGTHRIPWTDVLDIGYSRLFSCYYIHTLPVRRIYCSPMQAGYHELGAFLIEKHKGLYSETP